MTMTVASGSKVEFESYQPISHVGMMEWYMAKVPGGHTAATGMEVANFGTKLMKIGQLSRH